MYIIGENIHIISEKVKDVATSENIKNYMIQLSQGSPFYLEVLSECYAKQAKAKDGRIDEKEVLLNTLAELLYDSNGILNQYFNNSVNFFLEKKSRKKFIPVLVSVALGNNTIKAMQENQGRKSRDLGELLQKLQGP